MEYVKLSYDGKYFLAYFINEKKEVKFTNLHEMLLYLRSK